MRPDLKFLKEIAAIVTAWNYVFAPVLIPLWGMVDRYQRNRWKEKVAYVKELAAEVMLQRELPSLEGAAKIRANRLAESLECWQHPFSWWTKWLVKELTNLLRPLYPHEFFNRCLWLDSWSNRLIMIMILATIYFFIILFYREYDDLLTVKLVRKLIIWNVILTWLLICLGMYVVPADMRDLDVSSLFTPVIIFCGQIACVWFYDRSSGKNKNKGFWNYLDLKEL